MKKQLLFRSHLGLGDHLICNAIVREKSKDTQVFVVCKRHNAATLSFMFRDDRNIEPIVVEDDNEADEFVKVCRNAGHDVLCLGYYGAPPFRHHSWDTDFYRQAGIPNHRRWSNFTCHRQPSRELKVPKDKPYCLVHQDRKRGFFIDTKYLPSDLRIIEVDPDRTNNMFDWWEHIEFATELHLLDSCFAILADFLPDLRARRVVVHEYAKPGAVVPTYQRGFEVIKSP